METNSRPDALTTAEVLEKVLSGAVVKTSLPLGRQLPLAFLAGLYIGLGGLFATLFFSDASLSFAVQRFGAGAVFSLGLSLVLIAGAELYTGNTMIAAGAAEGRISWGATLLNWVRVWLGNALGALTLVVLVFFAHTADLGTMANGMLGVAAGKLSAGWFTIFVKGILCNLLVCLGVWVGYAGRTVADKVLGVLLPVSASWRSGSSTASRTSTSCRSRWRSRLRVTSPKGSIRRSSPGRTSPKTSRRRRSATRWRARRLRCSTARPA